MIYYIIGLVALNIWFICSILLVVIIKIDMNGSGYRFKLWEWLLFIVLSPLILMNLLFED